jgi:hypothetical protein
LQAKASFAQQMPDAKIEIIEDTRYVVLATFTKVYR